MGTKDDWEQIEKDYALREEKIKKEYGADITKMHDENKKSLKRIDKLTHIMKIIGWTFATLFAIIIVILVIAMILIWKGQKNQVDINAIETIEAMYNKSFKVISEDLDEKGNGTYKVQTKGNDKINFTVIKLRGQYWDDYKDRCLKYYFENWDSDLKDLFTAEESTENQGIIRYAIYANVENLNQIDAVVDGYLKFKEYAKEFYFEDWNIEVRSESFKRPLVTGTGYSEKAIKDMLKRNYLIWNKKNNIEISDLSEEEIKKYNKPDQMKLAINGVEIIDKTFGATHQFIYDDETEQYTIMAYEFRDEGNLITVKTKLNGAIQEINYKDKTYTVGNKLDLDENLITYQISLDTILKMFDATAEFDYENEIINLVME